MLYQDRYKSFTLWAAISLIGLLALVLLVGVAQADITSELSYSSNNLAFQVTPTPTVYSPYVITGKVVDENGNAVQYAYVFNGIKRERTDTNGVFRFSNVQPGTYVVEVQDGTAYTPQSQTVTVPPSAEDVNFQRVQPTPTPTETNTPEGITPTPTVTSTPTNEEVTPTATSTNLPTFSISGRMTDRDGHGIAGAQIVTEPAIANYVTDSNGFYTIAGLSAGTYVVRAVVPGLAFEPLSTTVALTADKSNVNFQQICVSPITGLDMCSLEVGDILLWRGNFFLLFEPLANTAARIGMGSYWWHSGIFVGNGQIVEATGNRNDDADEVWKKYLVDSPWWKGAFLGGYPDSSFDWSVIRPRTTATNKQLAVNYAVQMADQDNPHILYVPPDDQLSFYDQVADSPTYCSKLVWKAYMQSNLNLERNMGLLGSTISRSVITPDDLYYSAIDFVGSLDALADIVQEKESLTNNRFIFFMLSPADLLITDSQGHRVGHDPVSGTTYDEILGAQYSGPNTEPESISLEANSSLTWTVQAVGTGVGGEYTIQTAILSGTHILTGTVTASISLGEKNVYQVNMQANQPSDVLEERQQQPIDNRRQLFLPLINK